VSTEIVRSAYDGFASGNIPAVLALIAPDCEWIETEAQGIPTSGVHRGPAGVAEGVFSKVPASFSEFALHPERFIERGDLVPVTGRVKGKSKVGRLLDAPFAHVFSIRDGLIVRLENYHDTALWLEALHA
jgi:ketosteroid isomerase-like protein